MQTSLNKLYQRKQTISNQMKPIISQTKPQEHSTNSQLTLKYRPSLNIYKKMPTHIHHVLFILTNTKKKKNIFYGCDFYAMGKVHIFLYSVVFSLYELYLTLRPPHDVEKLRLTKYYSIHTRKDNYFELFTGNDGC